MKNNHCKEPERADKIRWPWEATPGLMAMVVCLIWSTQGIAGELRPYNPPSVQSENLRAFSDKMPSVKASPVVEEDVYRRFLKAVVAMNAEKKKALVTGIKDKRDTAVRGGELEEAKHYMRLLDTVEMQQVGGIR